MKKWYSLIDKIYRKENLELAFKRVKRNHGKCFDTLDHEIIMDSVAELISDGKVLMLIRKFLKSGVMKSETFEATEIGSCQGGLCRARHNPPYVELDIMPSYSI